jgi:hypothetical protein
VTRAEVLGYIAALAAEFWKRGMRSHSHHARGWPDELVFEWMRTLQLPPFEAAYQVRPRNQGCPACPRGTESVFTECVFQGSDGKSLGSRHHCSQCGSTWLELDGK